jgi:hypothetical protein
VAYLEHVTSGVDLRDASGVGLHSLMRVSLQRSGSLHLESLRHALGRGVCGAKGLWEWQWLLKRDHFRSGDVLWLAALHMHQAPHNLQER